MFRLPILITIFAFLPIYRQRSYVTLRHRLYTLEIIATCSKMFIGGLNWDTTDGTGLCTVFHSMSSTKLVCYTRITQKVLHPVWQSRRLHNHARLHGSFQMFRVPHI